MAAWYGINQYLFYTINDSWKAGMRFEWFSDLHGSRIPGDTRADQLLRAYLGRELDAQPTGLVRPEIRWDWSGTPDVYALRRRHALQSTAAGLRRDRAVLMLFKHHSPASSGRS